MLDQKELTVDSVNETLDSLRLQCPSNAGTSGKLKSEKVYGQLLAESIRGNLHIITLNKVMGVLSPNDHSREE